jgi:hypothetical protein
MELRSTQTAGIPVSDRSFASFERRLAECSAETLEQF